MNMETGATPVLRDRSSPHRHFPSHQPALVFLRRRRFVFAGAWFVAAAPGGVTTSPWLAAAAAWFVATPSDVRTLVDIAQGTAQ